MNFALTDDQLMIRDVAEAFLAEASGSHAVRSAMAEPSGFDPALWARVGSELGWCATAIPEADGGLGLGMVELALLFEQLGRRQACLPFFSTVALAAVALCEVGGTAARQRWLPRIAEGGLRATLALGSNGVQWSVQGCGVTAVRSADDGWRLDGRCAHVPDGATAELLLVAARIDVPGEPLFGLFAVQADAAGLRLDALETWDATRRLASIKLDALHLDDTARIDTVGLEGEDFERIEALAALLLAAEQLGGAQQCLDLTLAYTSERAQFGQPIAAFQAIKHRCAEMMVRIEATRSLVYGAAALADTRPSTHELVMEAGAAKAQASETFFSCAQEAIQLHGGVGFTWEYDPHLYFKRAQAGSCWLGTPDLWRERIASSLLDGNDD